MKTEVQGRRDACDTDEQGRRDALNRAGWMKGLARGGVAVGLLGLCTVLARREEKFECSSRCGRCPKFNDGNCSLGLR